jgi:hypothetical protein
LPVEVRVRVAVGRPCDTKVVRMSELSARRPVVPGRVVLG